MELNAGEIVERVVRRNRVSITELARRLKVNRRSVYNWFEQKTLKLEIICRIGQVLNHDFSVDFPDAFGGRGFLPMERLVDTMHESENGSSNSVHYWMVKYISLLEKYNDLLSQANSKDDPVDHTNIKRLQKKSFSQDVFTSDSMSL